MLEVHENYLLCQEEDFLALILSPVPESGKIVRSYSTSSESARKLLPTGGRIVGLLVNKTARVPLTPCCDVHYHESQLIKELLTVSMLSPLNFPKSNEFLKVRCTHERSHAYRFITNLSLPQRHTPSKSLEKGHSTVSTALPSLLGNKRCYRQLTLE